MPRKTIWTAQSKTQLVAAFARRGFDRADIRMTAEHAYAHGHAATLMLDMPGHMLVISYGNTEVDAWDAEIIPVAEYDARYSRPVATTEPGTYDNPFGYGDGSAPIAAYYRPIAATLANPESIAEMRGAVTDAHRAPVGTVATGRDIPASTDTNPVGTGRAWYLRAHGVRFGLDHLNGMMQLQAFNSPGCVPATPDDIRAHRVAAALNGRYPFAPIRRYMPTPTVDALLAALAGHSDGLGYLWGSAYTPEYRRVSAPWEGRLAMVRAHGVYGMWETKSALNAINGLAWERAESLRTPDDCGGEFCDDGATVGPCSACARAARWEREHAGMDTVTARRSLLRLIDDRPAW